MLFVLPFRLFGSPFLTSVPHERFGLGLVCPVVVTLWSTLRDFMPYERFDLRVVRPAVSTFRFTLPDFRST